MLNQVDLTPYLSLFIAIFPYLLSKMVKMSYLYTALYKKPNDTTE